MKWRKMRMVKVDIDVPDEVAKFLKAFGFDVADYARKSLLDNLAGDLNAGIETFIDLDDLIDKYGLNKVPGLAEQLDKSMFKSLKGETE